MNGYSGTLRSPCLSIQINGSTFGGMTFCVTYKHLNEVLRVLVETLPSHPHPTKEKEFESYGSKSFEKLIWGVPIVAQWVTNLTGVHEDVGSIPGLTQWVKDPPMLWMWYRPATAAPIQPLAWEFPYATGEALKSSK